MANKNGAHESTLRGAGKIRTETNWNAGFITRSPVANRPQTYFGYLGASGIAPCSSWGLSVRPRTTLHLGAKAGPTNPSKREYAQTPENSAGWDLEPIIRTVLVQAERPQGGAKSPRIMPPPPERLRGHPEGETRRKWALKATYSVML